jgi:hypothetical protein
MFANQTCRYIKAQRIRWIECIVRMDKERTVKRMGSGDQLQLEGLVD